MSKIFNMTLIYYTKSTNNITIVDSICSDGVKTGNEQWDDANNQSKDGWDSDWHIETSWTWSGGSKQSKDTCIEIWGDGVRFDKSQCLAKYIIEIYYCVLIFLWRLL